MFRIGVFSKLSEVSVRTLRLYDSLGLIKPSHVDEESGYRYYALDQLPRLRRVLALKDLGLSLEQIARLVNDESRRPELTPQRLSVLLHEKQRELCARVREEQARLARVEALLRQIDKENKMPDYDILIKPVAPQFVASVRDTIPNWESVSTTLNRLFDEVYEYVCAQGGQFTGPGLDLWYDPEPRREDMDVEAAMPIAAPLPESERVRVHELLGVEAAATTTHHGGFDSIGDAHEAVMRWVESNGYRISGPGREVYLQYDRQGDPARWVTELQYPVTKL